MTSTSQTWQIRDHEIEALRTLTSASDALLAERRLQKRTEKKFIAPRAAFDALIAALGDDFHVVLSGGLPWATYDTLYFDSEEFTLFDEHRRGRRPRHKVRIRQYVERDLCYLETKTKDRYSVTTKHRFPRPSGDFDLRAEDLQAVGDSIGRGLDLDAAVRMQFPRVTLIGVDHAERITVDLGLRMDHHGVVVAYEDVCIVEIKQARFNALSPGQLAIRRLKLRPHTISKYCVALAVLGRVDRTNQFRPAIRELERNSHA